VDDWLAFYDPSLTVDEHREVYEQAAQEDRGRRREDTESAVEKAGRASRAAQSEQCEHARDYCRHGDPDACEFLTDRCGLDENEVDQILGGGDETDEITGEAAGALQRAWNGYKAGISALDQALEGVADEWSEAQQAADAINGVRDSHGQDPIHFERLEELQADVLDLAREMAADCVECHADHNTHDHAVTAGEREDVREFADEGRGSTPVGTSGDVSTADQPDT